jgi:hypothetical protein
MGQNLFLNEKFYILKNSLIIVISGVINSFLSWGFFVPLARITYMAYLIHYEVLMVFYNSADYAMEMDNLLIVSTQITITLATSY